jgi:hypothetical protein
LATCWDAVRAFVLVFEGRRPKPPALEIARSAQIPIGRRLQLWPPKANEAVVITRMGVRAPLRDHCGAFHGKEVALGRLQKACATKWSDRLGADLIQAVGIIITKSELVWARVEFREVTRENENALAPLVRRRKGPLRLLEPVGIEPGDYWDAL